MNVQNEKPALHPAIILLMAIAAGVVVANIYYNQPILKEIAVSINATESEIGRISMLSQLGYGLGMFFLLPLGDMLNRKKLILFISAMLTITLILVAFSFTLAGICILSLFVGLFSRSCTDHPAYGGYAG